jgi:hypothetical protein
MHGMLKYFALLALFSTAGCSLPGYSIRDKNYFSEQPYILASDGHYALIYRYGQLGCAFSPESNVVNGELHFKLLATTSSSCIPGRLDSRPITKPEQIRALEEHGAFWLEPDGSKLRLEVRH